MLADVASPAGGYLRIGLGRPSKVYFTIQREGCALADGIPDGAVAAGAFESASAADDPVRALDDQVAADWRFVVNAQRAAAGELKRERALDLAAAVFGPDLVVERKGSAG